MLTLCADPRCTAAGKCWRAQYERYGNAPGLNYGPRCTPAVADAYRAVIGNLHVGLGLTKKEKP